MKKLGWLTVDFYVALHFTCPLQHVLPAYGNTVYQVYFYVLLPQCQVHTCKKSKSIWFTRFNKIHGLSVEREMNCNISMRQLSFGLLSHCNLTAGYLGTWFTPNKHKRLENSACNKCSQLPVVSIDRIIVNHCIN